MMIVDIDKNIVLLDLIDSFIILKIKDNFGEIIVIGIYDNKNK